MPVIGICLALNFLTKLYIQPVHFKIRHFINVYGYMYTYTGTTSVTYISTLLIDTELQWR